MSRNPIPGVFGFETYMERTLEYMPMSVRLKLDLCGLKPSLVQWCGLPLTVRQTVLETHCEVPHEILRMRRYLESTFDAFQLGPLAPLQCSAEAWNANSRVPAALVLATTALGLPRPARAAWAGLSNLQRFALIKLSHEGRARKLESALEEFGLHRRHEADTTVHAAEAGGGDREAQVFALLAKALEEGTHREFARAIDGDGED
jgi:hypothetical protein